MLTDFPAFRPKRLMRSAHAQTLGAYFFRGKRPDYRGEKHTVALHDGDRLVIHDDRPESWITGDRIVILFHGLCGCHLAPYMVRTAHKLNQLGIRTVRIDMRGFGDSTLISKSHLHGGCSEDAIAVVDYVNRMSPLSPLSLVGFSIGGNIILRTLGLWGENHHPNVDSAVAVCPPIDLVHCAVNLRQYGNRIYEKYFVNRLSHQLALRRKLVDGLVDNGVNPLPSRLIHWDDQFTAPCWGYGSAMEYYEDASSIGLLDRIAVRTLILTAQDDPVVPFSMFDRSAMSSYIDVIAPTHGGHLGFLAKGRKDPDRHWMDWRICEWVKLIDDQFEIKGIKQRGSQPQELSGQRYSNQV